MSEDKKIAVKAVDVIIERDPMTKIPKRILDWELPIYQEKYPTGIEVIGDAVEHVDELPDAEAEANRMRVLHGADPKTGAVYFDDVYGRGRAGVAEFEKAIHAARVKPAKPAKPAKPVKESDDDKASDNAGSDGADGAGAPKDPLDDPA